MDRQVKTAPTLLAIGSAGEIPQSQFYQSKQRCIQDINYSFSFFFYLVAPARMITKGYLNTDAIN